MALKGPVYGCEKLVVALLRHHLQHVLIEVGAVASEDGFMRSDQFGSCLQHFVVPG